MFCHNLQAPTFNEEMSFVEPLNPRCPHQVRTLEEVGTVSRMPFRLQTGAVKSVQETVSEGLLVALLTLKDFNWLVTVAKRITY
jgi:hypothetical protein